MKPGKYKHYKGNMYEVLFVAIHSETEEQLVIYKALYGEQRIWARPLKMFNEMVEYQGKMLHDLNMCQTKPSTRRLFFI